MSYRYLAFVWFDGSDIPRAVIKDKNVRYWKRESGRLRKIRRATPDEERAFYRGQLDITAVPISPPAEAQRRQSRQCPGHQAQGQR